MLRSAPCLAVVALAAAACGVQLEGSGITDAATDSSPRPPDGAVLPDARACTGGDAAMTSSDGSCFLLFTTPRSFADAKAACLAIDTHLAITNTAERYAVAKTLAGARDVFIGLTDEVTENAFVWVDTTALAFTAWDPNEPNNSAGGGFEEDCVLIAGVRGGDWDDRPCATNVGPAGTGSYSYLCQF